MQRLVTDLNRIYRETNALWSQDNDPAGFHWIDANDAMGNVYSFLRFGTDGSIIACVANFSPVPHERYQLGLPKAGRWEEVVNTDAEVYFGSGVGNFGGVDAGDQAWHGQPASVTLRIPPLGSDLVALDRISRSDLLLPSALLDRSRPGAMLGDAAWGIPRPGLALLRHLVADATFWRLICPL